MSGSDIISRNAKKKKEEESNNYSGASAIIRRNIEYRAKEFTSSLPERLNNLQQTKNQMYKTYNSRFVDENGNYKNKYRGDTKSALSSFQSSRNSYESEVKIFLDKLSTYEKYLDKEQVEKIRASLTDNSDLDDIYKVYQSDDDYFSQWENENAYNYSVSQAEKKKKYSDMTDEELDSAIDENEGSFWDKIMDTVSTTGLSDEYLKTTTSNLNADPNVKKGIIADAKNNKNKIYEKQADTSLMNEEKNFRKWEELDELPEDVKSLIEEYTELDRTKDESDINTFLQGVTSALTNNDNVTALSSGKTQLRKKEIAEELETKGVDNWQELVGYNRIRRDEEHYQPITDYTEELATEHPVLASGASVLASPTKVLGVGEMVKSAVSGTDAPVNYNSPYFAGNNFVNTTRNTVMENYDWEGKNTNIDWFDQIYSGVMSTGDSLFTMALTGGTGVGGVVLGASAASDTAQEVARNGGSKEQALLTGLTAGVNEMLWESVSIGNFNALKEKGISKLISKDGIKTLVGNLLKSAGVNASEEAMTEVSNTISDYIINGGASDYAQAYEAYLSGGYTEDEAREKARDDMINQVVMSGIGGAMQGLFMGGLGSGIGTVANTSENRAEAAKYTEADVKSLQNKALELGLTEADIDITETGGGPWNESGFSVNKVAELIGKVEEAQIQQPKNQIINKAKSYGIETGYFDTETKTGLKKLVKKINRVETEIETRSSELQDSIMKNAMREHLIELGESETNAKLISNAVIKNVNGEELDAHETTVLKSKQAQAVYDEFISGNAEWVDAADIEAVRATKELIDSYKVSEQEDKPATKATENITQNAENITQNAENITVNEKNPQQNTENVTESVKPSENTVATEEAKAFASQMETSEKKQAALKLYNKYLDRNPDYKAAFDAYYNAGLKGIGTFEGADKYITYAEQFPQSWRRAVFNAGRETKTYTPGVNRMYVNNSLSKTQKAQLKILDEIGKKYGISFLVFDKLSDEGGALNGIQFEGTNKIAISLSSEGSLYLRTAGHEVFHIIEEWNSEAAHELRNKVIEYLKQSNNYDYAAMVKEYAKTYSADADTTEGLRVIHSEMAADCMFDVFSNEKFVKKLVNENETLSRKIKNFLTDFISVLRKLIKSYTGSAEMNALKEQADILEEINKSFATALDTASANMKNALSSQSETKNTAPGDGVKKSYAGVKAKSQRITIDMTDAEKTKILENKKILAPTYNEITDESINREQLENESKRNFIKATLIKIGEEFNVFSSYKIEDIDVEVVFSKSNINESINKKVNPIQLAKLFPVLKESVENSVGIEMHTNRYYYDNTTSHFENLLGGYIDGEYFVPVRFGLKHIKGGSPVLYVVVDQNTIEKNKIETEVVKTTTLEKEGSAVSRSISKIKISQIIPFVKSEDVLRYLPDGMLSREQQKIKKNAIERTVRYTNDKNDRKYIDFINKGNMQAAKQMIDGAAKANGYTIKAYHGTPSNDFTTFDAKKIGSNTDAGIFGRGFYFTTHKDTASVYATESGHTMPVYLRVNNPWWAVSHRNIKDVAEELGMDEAAFTLRGYGGKGRIVTPTISQSGQFSEHLKERGYDAVVVQHGSNNYEIVMFDSNTIKSAEPVTYDDNGEIIPLSERFKENNPDIRYSRQMSSSARKILDSSPELSMIFKELQQEAKLSKGFIPEGKRIKEYAQKLKKDNMSTLSVSEIEKELRDIYEVLSSLDDSEGYEYASELTSSLAIKVVSNSKVLDDINAEKKELRGRLSGYLKGKQWYLSPEMRTEIEYHYDSYGNFHKKIFGRGFSFSDKSTNYLDSDWSGICAEFPELFDSDTPAVEQPLALLEAFSATEYEFGLTDDDQFNSQVKCVVTDIMNVLADIPAAETAFDKMTAAHFKKISVLEAQNKEKISELKQQYADDIKRTQEQADARYKLQIKRNIESQKAAEIKKRIETQIVRLSNMLAKGSKNRHIPLKLIDTVRELCYAITLNPASQTKLGENLSIIEASYAALKQGKDGPDGKPDDQFLMNAYDEYVHELIKQLKTQLQHKLIGNMSLEELQLVDETVRAVAQRVSRGNELHIESRNSGVDETANAIAAELGPAKVKREYKKAWMNEASDKLDNDAWKFLKPVYAWRMMGSDTFAEIMGNIRKGEDTWATDLYEAREKITDLAGKYNKKEWSTEKQEVKLSSGTYQFSVQQMMMLYVAFQREQYRTHLIGVETQGEFGKRMKGGGFVFEDAYKTVESLKDGTKKKPKVYRQRDAGTHRLAAEDFDVIASALSIEQKGYADEMRDYLSKDLAVKGNEITRKLYDMNKFTEDKYFPIKVSRKFLDGTMKEPEVRSVLSTSIMKDLQENADDPVLLRDFDTMWAEHVQQMAMFHAFALPLDDYQRVYNFRTTKGKIASVKDIFETSCGKGAVSYIENFIKDVNGGVRAQNGAALVNSAISKFKKGAVFASASVAIQQPSAIARALAVVDAKYFAKTTVTKRDYDELSKYAPVARVKAMGFFDTSIGQSTVEWLTAARYNNAKDRAKAVFTDSSYRDELLSKAPEKMDELTWGHIWNAVKAEQAETTGLKGEELLKKAGERFTEVIELTQVYDSVFSKSELMRSKDTGVKMMTAFMAEPTVSFNMLVDATVQAKRGNLKGWARFVGAFAASVILNNILKALVTAPRDDDEEKTLVEKYIASVTDGIVNDLNPLSLIPIVKDVMSIFNGYSVERADMSLVQDVYDALSSIDSSEKSAYRKVEDIAVAIAAFFGLPVKNVVRDFRGACNFAIGVFGLEKTDEYGKTQTVAKGVRETTAEGIKKAVKENFNDNLYQKVIKERLFGTPEEQLYEAIKNNDYAAYEKLQKNEYGGDSTKVNAAKRKALAEYDERIMQAAQARMDGNSVLYGKLVNEVRADGFSETDIYNAVNSVYNKLTDDGEESETVEKAHSLYSSEDLMNALETGSNYQEIIDDMINAKVKNGSTVKEAKSSVKTSIASYWKPIYFEASESEREEIRELLDSTGLYEDIERTTVTWVWNILKDEYIAAESSTERNRIKSEVWKSGYFDSYSDMNKRLRELLEEADEEYED